jgi:hypothetical protein
MRNNSSHSDAPKPRTYAAGEDASLPELGSETRPVGIGRRTSDGKDVPEVRAFLATIRNRGDATMWIVEGDGDDPAMIRPGESYHVPALNGTDKLHLAANAEGYTDYEIRTIEGHNDFSLVDRVEGFVQSIAMLLRSARTTTTISGQDVPLTIDDAGGLTVTGEVGVDGDVGISGDVSVSEIDSPVDVSGPLNVATVDGTVSVDAADGVSIPVEATGSVKTQIDGVDGGVMLPVSIDGSNSTVGVNLTATDVTLPVSIDSSTANLSTTITGSTVPIEAVVTGADVNLNTEIVGQVGSIETTVIEEIDSRQTSNFAEFVETQTNSTSGTGFSNGSYGIGVNENVLLQVRNKGHNVTFSVSAGSDEYLFMDLIEYVGPPDIIVGSHTIQFEPGSSGTYTAEYSTTEGWAIPGNNSNTRSMSSSTGSRLGQGDYFDVEVQMRDPGYDDILDNWSAETILRFDGVTR